MSCARRSMVFLLLASLAFAAQWTPAGAGLTGSIPAVNALVIDRSIGSTLYAVTSLTPLRLGAEANSIFNVFKSTDGGANWKALANIAGVNVLALDPISASTIYAGTAGGVFKSTDAGASWTAVTVGPRARPLGAVGSLTLDPLTPSTLYVVDGGIPPYSLYKSTDAGQSWSVVSSGIGSPLAIAPTKPSTL